MKRHTIAILGGASTYTPGIVRSLLNAAGRLPLKKLVLQDPDTERLALMGRYLQILLRDEAIEVELGWTTDREEALQGVDFVFTQIRPGGLEMRELDEKIPLARGLVGQETCGAGGFAFALRTIHPMLDIVRDTRRIAPEAWILNYSNPLPILAEAVRREVPDARCLFICDMPIVQQMTMAKTLGYQEHELRFEYFGLNHFGWFSSIKNTGGQELLPCLREKMRSPEGLQLAEFGHLDAHWRRIFAHLSHYVETFPDFIPLTYLHYYLFPDEVVKEANPAYTRANEVMDHRRKRVFEDCAAVIAANSFKGFEHTADAHGDFIVDQAIALAHDTHARFTVNVVNQGIFPNFPEDAVIETFGTIGRNGVKVHHTFELPPLQRALMLAQNTYEKLTVEAALEGSYAKALQALALNRTIPSVHKAKAVLDDLIAANGAHFPTLR